MKKRFSLLTNKGTVLRIRPGRYAGWDGGKRGRKIFGRLTCASGKRLIKSGRVFFASYEAAVAAGFRPCKKCLPSRYDDYRRVDGAWKLVRRYRTWTHTGPHVGITPGRYAGRSEDKSHLRYFGRLDCPLGIRDAPRNDERFDARVFFATWEDAIKSGYAPCPVCQPKKTDTYERIKKKWVRRGRES